MGRRGRKRHGAANAGVGGFRVGAIREGSEREGLRFWYYEFLGERGLWTNLWRDRVDSFLVIGNGLPSGHLFPGSQVSLCGGIEHFYADF